MNRNTALAPSIDVPTWKRPALHGDFHPIAVHTLSVLPGAVPTRIGSNAMCHHA